MMLKTHAIVLRSLKYGESQVIADLLTEEVGRLSFICKVPKTSKAKVKKQFLQPLTILEIEFDYRQNSKMQHFKDMRVVYPYSSIPFDAVKLSISLFIAEFVCYATRDEQNNVPLYKYVETSLQWLDGLERSYANFHLVFMMRLTRFIGFFPNLDDEAEGSFFDMRNACFSAVPPLHADFLYPEEASKIRILMRMRYETMHLFAMSRQERNRCVELILGFYRLHLPNFPELKSWDVLKELFG